MSTDLAVIVIFVGMLALVAMIPALFVRVRTLYGLLLPELVRLNSPKDRRSAAQESMKVIHGDAWFGLFTGVSLAAWLAYFGRGPAWSISSLALFLAMHLLPPCLIACVLFWCLFRERVRRALWRQLAERGHAICGECGYDLRGQTEPRCPECGQRFG